MNIYWSPTHNDYIFSDVFTNQPNAYHFLVKGVDDGAVWIEMWSEFYTNLELVAEVEL